MDPCFVPRLAARPQSRPLRTLRVCALWPEADERILDPKKRIVAARESGSNKRNRRAAGVH